MLKSIKDWKEDDRPREKLLHQGAKYLSDSELLAILINNGTEGKSAIDLAKEILLSVDNDLTKLVGADVSLLKKTKGIGDAKAITISAAFELAKRIKVKSFGELKVFRSPEEVANYFNPEFIGIKQEKFFVLLLNSSNQIIRKVDITSGLVDRSLVHPREVFRAAIVENASSMIVLHNHPSGNPNPSIADKDVTRILIEAGKIIEIKVLDHIILAGNSFYSFAREGLID